MLEEFVPHWMATDPAPGLRIRLVEPSMLNTFWLKTVSPANAAELLKKTAVLPDPAVAAV